MGAALYGCGGSAGDKAVVQVAGTKITQATFDHWLSIAAIRDYKLAPLTPIPSGVVPDPPAFTRCVAYLKGLAPKTATPAAGGSLVLRAQCAQHYQTLRTQALNELITAQWLLAEGRARHLTASDSAVRAFYEMTWKGEYKSRADLHKSMALIGETEADRLFRARVKVISAAIEKQYGAKDFKGFANNHALLKFLTEFPKHWAAKTDCKAGYVVPNCKQYKGTVAPEALLL